MNSKLFIADKVKVGFNPRTDTYSGKLGYVIGFDGKKWRKEPSWDGWRYHYMDDDTYEQKRRVQYNDYLARQINNYKDLVKRYNDDPVRNSHYKQYADMTEADYLKKHLGDYEKFTPNLGRFSSDKSLLPIEFDNVPTEGFVLNKKVGGYSNGWDHRATYCRVYDPRGFEFEISVPNLLFILQECNAMKGKGLEGSFVYAWDGKDLVLLPTSSLDYQESQKFTEMQSQKIGVKDLVEGCTYKTKQMEEYIYLGRFNWFEEHYRYSSDRHDKVSCEKRHVFYKVEIPKWGERIESFNGLTKFAMKTSDTPVSNYAELLDEFNTSKFSGVLNDIEEIDAHIPTELTYSHHTSETIGYCYLPLGNNQYEEYVLETDAVEYPNASYYNNRNNKNKIKTYKLSTKKVITLKDGVVKTKTIKPKLIEKISYESLKDMKLKLVTVNKNNKKRVLVF
jgi:hypothetical protein